MPTPDFDLNSVRFRTSKPTVQDMMRLSVFVAGPDNEYHFSAGISLMLRRAEPGQGLTSEGIMELELEEFYALAEACIANIPNADGSFLYPDCSDNKEPYGTVGDHQKARKEKRTGPPDPKLAQKLNKIWGES